MANNNGERIFGRKFLEKSIAVSGIQETLKTKKIALLSNVKHWVDMLDKGIVKDEESFQDPFINDIFKGALGYTRQGDATPWTCTREYKTKGGKSLDAALGFHEKGEKEDETTYVVVELKAPYIKNLERKPALEALSPVEQGFDYASKIGQTCRWVIISNMDEVRLYRSNDQKRFEIFYLSDIAKNTKEFERFYFLLCRENLLPFSPKAELSTLDDLFKRNQTDQAKINQDFYIVYSGAREDIFHAICKANPSVDKLTILSKTETILDRFIFICFCEDRGFITDSSEGLKPTDLILKAPKHGFRGSIWCEFLDFSAAINDGADTPIKIPPYNGGLFKKDIELESLVVPNEALKPLETVAGHDFESELDVTILGHIFEQSITDIEKMKSEVKGEVFDQKKGKRKRQGIYYTPPYITGYIVENCVDLWLEDRKYEIGFDNLPPLSKEEEMYLSEAEGSQIAKNSKNALSKELSQKAQAHAKAWQALQERLSCIKILDPACGSGAFLNKALDYLVKKHEEIASHLYHFGRTDWSLKALGEKHLEEWVVKNNIFGVDLSKESVEITKLSLWLKVVRFKEPLPNLDENIKFGDSIVEDKAFSDFSFDWQKEFPKIFSYCPPPGMDVKDSNNSVNNNPPPRGRELMAGFDIVIGNPPYVRQEAIKKVKPALAKEYPDVYDSTADLYVYFYRRGFQLLKPGGILGFISSITFNRAAYGNKLRLYLKHNTMIQAFVDFGMFQLFESATNLVCIFIARNNKPENNIVRFLKIKELPDDSTDQKSMIQKSISLNYPQMQLGKDSWNFEIPAVEALVKKIFSKGRPLKDLVGEPLYGVKTGLNEAFFIDKATRDKLIQEDPKSIEIIKPLLVGEDIKQWYYDFRERYLIFTRRGVDIEKYPAIKTYLEQFRDRLEPKPSNWPENKKWNGRKPGPYKWYEIQDNVAYYRVFDEPKIIYPEFNIKPKFTFDSYGCYTNNKAFIIDNPPKYLQSILNSRLLWIIISKICSIKLGEVYELRTIYANTLPIVEPSDENNDALSSLAKFCQDKVFERSKIRKQFVDFVGSEIRQYFKSASTKPVFNDVSPGSDVNKFDTLTWDEFCSRAQTRAAYGRPFKEYTGNLKNKSALKQYFEETKALCANLSAQIHKAEDEINSIVYKLYDLTPDEITLLEDLTQGIYED